MIVQVLDDVLRFTRGEFFVCHMTAVARAWSGQNPMTGRRWLLWMLAKKAKALAHLKRRKTRKF